MRSMYINLRLFKTDLSNYKEEEEEEEEEQETEQEEEQEEELSNWILTSCQRYRAKEEAREKEDGEGKDEERRSKKIGGRMEGRKEASKQEE